MTEFQKKKLAFKKALNEGVEKVFASGEATAKDGMWFASDVRKELRKLLGQEDEVAVRIIDTYSAMRNTYKKFELFMYTDRFKNNFKELEGFEYVVESFFPAPGGDHFIKRK